MTKQLEISIGFESKRQSFQSIEIFIVVLSLETLNDHWLELFPFFVFIH